MGFGDHSLQGGVLETVPLPVAGQTGALHTCVAGWWPAVKSSWQVSAGPADWLAGIAPAGNHQTMDGYSLELGAHPQRLPLNVLECLLWLTLALIYEAP